MQATTTRSENPPELKLWEVSLYGAVSTRLARMLIRIARQERKICRSHKPPTAKKEVVREQL